MGAQGRGTTGGEPSTNGEIHLDLQDELDEQTSISVCPGGAGDVDRVPVVGRDDERGRVEKSWSAGRWDYISDSDTDRMTNSEGAESGETGRGLIQFTHTGPMGNPGGESRSPPSCNTDGVVTFTTKFSKKKIKKNKKEF